MLACSAQAAQIHLHQTTYAHALPFSPPATVGDARSVWPMVKNLCDPDVRLDNGQNATIIGTMLSGPVGVVSVLSSQ
jgi:acetoacetate decarboxylase